MAVFGDLRYLNAYKSTEELIKDFNLKVGKTVMVDTGDSLTWYSIRDKMVRQEAIPLDNGLFAIKVLTNNQSAELLGQTYTTDGPVRVSVGGVQEGREFKKASMTEVFNALFYPSVAVDFDIDLNLTTLSYIIGESIMLTDVLVYNIKGDGVYSAVLSINGEEIREDFFDDTIGEHHFLINRVIDETSVVEVRINSVNGSSSVSETITFGNPVYWGVQSENYSPTSTSVQRDFNRTSFENSQLEVEVTGSSQCLFFIIESSIPIEGIYDESRNLITDNFSSGSEIKMFFGTQEVVYKVYKSNIFSTEAYDKGYSIMVRSGGAV